MEKQPVTLWNDGLTQPLTLLNQPPPFPKIHPATDIKIYTIIITGIAITSNMNSKGKEISKKTYLVMLFPNLYSLNFSENMGILETKRSDSTRVETNNR